MAKYATKQDVLNKFGITKMSQLTTEMAVELFSMVPEMDVELAKEVIAQVPNFSEKARNMLLDYENQVGKIVEVNKDIDKQFINACLSVIDALKPLTLDENLPIESKMLIVDKICDIEQDMKEIVTNQQSFNADVIKYLTIGLGAAIMTIGAILGVKTSIKRN